MLITYEINGVKYYKQVYYFDCQISSIEDGVKLGDTRVILDRLFYAWNVNHRIVRKNIVRWSLLNACKEDIEQFITELGRI